ncbi:hypothetical protein [Ruegeria sp. HKCCA6707]|nr:hypothetical protein [Ruegeria sp. HKCCA6707]
MNTDADDPTIYFYAQTVAYAEFSNFAPFKDVSTQLRRPLQLHGSSIL